MSRECLQGSPVRGARRANTEDEVRAREPSSWQWRMEIRARTKKPNAKGKRHRSAKHGGNQYLLASIGVRLTARLGWGAYEMALRTSKPQNLARCLEAA